MCIYEPAIETTCHLIRSAVKEMSASTVDCLPNPTTVSQFAYELGVISDLQVEDVMAKHNNLTLACDATSLHAEHFNEVHITVPTVPMNGNKNYHGSSGGMGVSAAEQLWWRSTERGFRYTTMLSDGDARTFNHLSGWQMYGDVELQKEECINHVSKRLGTALRQVGSIREEGWRHARRAGLREN